MINSWLVLEKIFHEYNSLNKGKLCSAVRKTIYSVNLKVLQECRDSVVLIKTGPLVWLKPGCRWERWRNVSTISRLHGTRLCSNRKCKRSGQPRETTNAQDRYIALSNHRNRFQTAPTTAAESMQSRRGHMSVITVRRRLREGGIFNRRPHVGLLLTAQRRQRCLAWARQHLPITRLQWQTVMFSDESCFNLYHRDGRMRIWRKRGECFADNCIILHDRFGGGSVHVWGDISFHHRTPLHVFRGLVNAQTYISDVLRPIVIPDLQRTNRFKCNSMIVLRHIQHVRPKLSCSNKA